jgi:hypothetical protein
MADLLGFHFIDPALQRSVGLGLHARAGLTLSSNLAYKSRLCPLKIARFPTKMAHSYNNKKAPVLAGAFKIEY